jgi:peptidoglycan/LPS O-acetylase OafA/YrhL
MLSKQTPSSVFREHIRCLDGLRGLAVLMVLWAHSTPISGAVERKLGFSFGFGYLGVEIFFVLSGFLITRILLWDRVQGVPLRYFLARRFLRIFPIYYLTLAVAWFLWRDPLAPWAAIYFSNYYNAIYAPVTHLSHTWSLAVEEHFYIVWPLIVCFLPRNSAKWVALGVFPVIAIATAIFIITRHYTDQNVTIRLIHEGSLCRMMSLGIGATLAFYEGSLRAMSKRTWLILLALAVTGAALSQMPARIVTFRYTPLTKLAGFALFSGASMAALIRLRNSRIFPLPLLRSNALTFIGRISYGLYLYHMPIYVQLDCQTAEHTTPLWKNFLAIGITVVVAVASFYLIESPILNLKKRFAAKPKQQTPDGADWPASEPKDTPDDTKTAESASG